VYSWNLFSGDPAGTSNMQDMRRALGSYPTGICLITLVTHQGKREGMTINSFASVSLEPPLVLCCVRDAARSAQAFIATRRFALNVLSVEQRDIAVHFARPAPDKFLAFENAFESGSAGCPLLRDAAAKFECSTYSQHTEGDHVVLIGRVERYAWRDAEPLLFYMGRMGSFGTLATSSMRAADHDFLSPHAGEA